MPQNNLKKLGTLGGISVSGVQKSLSNVFAYSKTLSASGANLFEAACAGAYLAGKAAEIAANYVLCCIKATAGDTSHKYGAKFEKSLFNLISAVQKEVE